ncbi:MAG: radical SAM family protein [Planctomycetota bacterium]|jgi:DNA repair photolyase
MNKATKTKATGTREWAGTTTNCMTGCEHNCRYCYARAMALQYGRIDSAADWASPRLCPEKKRRRKRRKVAHTIMFPSTHDITPATLGPCLEVIENILQPGNRLLIVSKPHLECIREICRQFAAFRNQIVFRFTITAVRRALLAYWEPGAPMFGERWGSLVIARARGFSTSVSCEPLLERDLVVELIETLTPEVTDTIWIGKMNQIRRRVVKGTSEEAIRRIEAGQTDEAVMRAYESLKDHPKIRWKDSYREVIERLGSGEC